jgi:hypothetical protein
VHLVQGMLIVRITAFPSAEAIQALARDRRW